MSQPRACRVCGCTDDRACVTEHGPCHWVTPNLCSACIGKPARMQPQTLGDSPIEARYVEQMNDIAFGLDRIFNGEARGAARKTGFVLLVFPFGSDDGRCNYISNGADRKDVVTLLKEQIARFEGQPEMKGRA